MVQRLLGAAVGALVTFLILWLGTLARPADELAWYLVAVVIGAVVTFLWPIIVGWLLLRRARSRRASQVEAEVQRQLAEKSRQS